VVHVADSERKAELIQLVVLLILVAVFYFIVIPAGVVDPSGQGLDEGLPPSFSPRLAAIVAAGLMLLRVLWLIAAGDGSVAAGDASAEPVVITGRTFMGIGAALLFAFALVPYLGFLAGGALLILILLLLMGERRVGLLAACPVLVMAGIWLLFERLLSVRLPAGGLFGH
jgi:hypothetical protein